MLLLEFVLFFVELTQIRCLPEFPIAINSHHVFNKVDYVGGSMPIVPSGILYFSVWKYGFFGAFLFVGYQIFSLLGMFEPYPLYGLGVLCFCFLIVILWVEQGDKRLLVKWDIDPERSNCDRLAKAFAYFSCCVFWPRFV